MKYNTRYSRGYIFVDLLKRVKYFLALISICFPCVLKAQVPQIISFQGQITSGGALFNGSGLFAFALVNSAGSVTYWSNDNTSVAGSQPSAAVSLTVSNGVYTVLLGDTSIAHMNIVSSSVFSNSDVRLRVWFNDGTHGFQLLSPDQRIASVGYAMQADSLAIGATVSASAITGTILADVLPARSGSGNLVLANSATLVTPNLGTPSYVNLANASGLLVPATSVTGSFSNNQLTNNSITLIAGSGLSGGGIVTLGQAITLNANVTGNSNQLLANNGIGGFSNITVGSGLSLSGSTLTGGSVVAVTTNNQSGVITSISNSTTTPNIRISLGDITPNSVNGITLAGGSGIINTASYNLNLAQSGTLGTAAYQNTSAFDAAGSASTAVTALNAANITSGILPVSYGGTGTASNTGTGSLVLSTNPALVTPNLGTPTYANLSNAVGYNASNISGLITNSQLTSNAITVTAGNGISLTGSATLGGSLTINATNNGTLTSVTTNNQSGVITSISNSTTTPNITISLGDITPNSVTANAGIYNLITVSTLNGYLYATTPTGTVSAVNTIPASVIAGNLSLSQLPASVVVTSTSNSSTGIGDTAIGNYALASNTTGNYNTATGYSSLNYNTTGIGNTATGYYVLRSNTTGNYNTAAGYYSLAANLTGPNNTATGAYTLYTNTTGYANTAIGNSALYSNTYGAANTAIGFNSIYSNSIGAYNTSVGSNSLYGNTLGNYNTATGYRALMASTTANNNTASGAYALFTNTTGANNTASGAYALYPNTTGANNTAVGIYTLNANTSGANNTAIGSNALYTNLTGNNNTAIGNNAGQLLTGSYNTYVGSYTGNSALYPFSTNSNYVVLSDGAGNVRGYFDNNGTLNVAGVVVMAHYTVTALPAAASYKYGECFVSDAVESPGTSLGYSPTSGGSTVRKVYSNGTAWLLE